MDQFDSQDASKPSSAAWQKRLAHIRVRTKYAYLKDKVTKPRTAFLEIYQEKLDWENQILELLAMQDRCLHAGDSEGYEKAANETEAVIEKKSTRMNRYMHIQLGTAFKHYFGEPVQYSVPENKPPAPFASRTFPYVYVPNAMPATNWVEHKLHWNIVVRTLLKRDIALVETLVRGADELGKRAFANVYFQTQHISLDLFDILILRKKFPAAEWPTPTYASSLLAK